MNEKNTIALVSPGDDPLPPARCSSVDIYVYHLGCELGRKAPVRIFARGSSGRTVNRDGIGIEEIPVSGSGPAYLRHVLKRSLRQGYRTIQVENRPRYITPLRKQFPHTRIVLNMHSTNFLAPKLIRPSEVVKSFRAVDAIVANSRYVHRQLLRRFPQFAAKYHAIHPGVDLGLFPSKRSKRGRAIRQAMRTHNGAGDGKAILLLVGRFLPRKGISVLLRALRGVYSKRTDFELWVVGGRPTGSSTFHKEVRNLSRGLPVRFFPFVSSRKIHRYYLASDLLLCPSQLPEAFGMVNVEAAASGLPALGSDAWGIRESIVTGVNGWRVRNYHSSQAWSEVITHLLSRRTEWQEMGAKARQLAVKRYSWKRVADEFDALYRSLSQSAQTTEQWSSPG